MTTRRRSSDSNADDYQRNYRRVENDVLGEVHSCEGHIPQLEQGACSSETPSHADSIWKGSSCEIAQGPPGLGTLSLLSPEIRDLIYELIPVENDPDIAFPCQPKDLRWTSKSLSRDLHRSCRPCTHVDFTFTCDVSSKEVIDDRYKWLQSKLYRQAHAHNLQNIHRVEIIVKNGAHPDLPTLCYRLVCMPPDRKALHIWFDGPRACHANLCKFQDQLAGSFEAAAMCINAAIEMMREPPSEILHASAAPNSMKANDGILSNLLRYYAAPSAEEHSGPAGTPALCFIACTNPRNGLLCYYFHPTAQHRLRKLVRDGFIIGDCTSPLDQGGVLEIDMFEWHHEFFDSKAEWDGQPQGPDWLP